jgi:hypothetical protein
MEHAIWFINAGGFVLLVDTEEKTSDTLAMSIMYRLSASARKRFQYAKAGSITEAQELINFFKEKAKEFRKGLKPEQQFGILVIWDSLTGNATEDQQAKVKKEGSAPVRAFPEQALQISNFYKSYTVDDAFITLMHVQHAKKNNDPNAVGDDEFIPNGGLEPKYKASYHFRMTSVKDIESQDWAGKQVRVKMIKSSLGENHRQLVLRVLWRHVWVDVPQFEEKSEGKYKVLPDPTGKVIKIEEAMALADQAVQALEPSQCEVFQDYIGINKKEIPETIVAPLCERKRLQQTWFDWGWSLGNLLHDMKYGELLYAGDKKALAELLDFTEGETGFVVSKEVFGDKEQHSFMDFGEAIEKNPEIVKKLKAFMAVTHYPTVQEFAAEHEASPERKKKEKKKW